MKGIVINSLFDFVLNKHNIELFNKIADEKYPFYNLDTYPDSDLTGYVVKISESNAPVPSIKVECL